MKTIKANRGQVLRGGPGAPRPDLLPAKMLARAPAAMHPAAQAKAPRPGSMPSPLRPGSVQAKGAKHWAARAPRPDLMPMRRAAERSAETQAAPSEGTIQPLWALGVGVGVGLWALAGQYLQAGYAFAKATQYFRFGLPAQRIGAPPIPQNGNSCGAHSVSRVLNIVNGTVYNGAQVDRIWRIVAYNAANPLYTSLSFPTVAMQQRDSNNDPLMMYMVLQEAGVNPQLYLERGVFTAGLGLGGWPGWFFDRYIDKVMSLVAYQNHDGPHQMAIGQTAIVLVAFAGGLHYITVEKTANSTYTVHDSNFGTANNVARGFHGGFTNSNGNLLPYMGLSMVV
jgi:hypothetical protein